MVDTEIQASNLQLEKNMNGFAVSEWDGVAIYNAGHRSHAW
jgi:hypothetical protein